MKTTMVFHGESPSLLELVQRSTAIAAEDGQLFEEAMAEMYKEPQPDWPAGEGPVAPAIQTTTPLPFTPVAGVSFEGPGTGLAGFSLTGAPPDMTLAVGPNHIAAWVNSQYAIFNKTGTLLLGPVNGNSLWTGVGNVCETTNRGDPILQYDRMANRWILSQFAFDVSGGAPVAPYYQCFAVSTSGDPTGSYVRYTVQFSSTSPSGLNDYGKLGVWPDGYYTSYVMFGGSPAGSNTGAALCVSDRVKMLASDPTATTLCSSIAFHAGGAAFLPADLDGTTPPSDLSQGGIFLRQSTTPSLRFLKLKANFAAGTVTLGNGFGGAPGSYINLPISATTFTCSGTGGACISQPGTTNKLDTLGSRLMYRLAYRNRGGVESMVVTQSVDPDGFGARGAAVRWYEIRNPLADPAGPNPPVVYQEGTFDPGSTGDRWMGSIASDKWGNMLIGYSLANAATNLKPSIALTGRAFSDPLHNMQAEHTAFVGTGSQTGTLTRWGDYSTMQIDPSNDQTFWFISQYLSADGTFNWRTRIMSYNFPAPAEFNVLDTVLVEGDAGAQNMEFTVTRSTTSGSQTVDIATLAGGTATANVDYTPLATTTLDFSEGQNSRTASVLVNGDMDIEPGETVFVALSNNTGNSIIADGSAVGIIVNDDFPDLTVGDDSRAENAGSAVVRISLSEAPVTDVTGVYSTADGSALAPGDYTSQTNTPFIIPAQATFVDLSIPLANDAVFETTESFTLSVSGVNGASVTDASGTVSILDDDPQATTTSITSILPEVTVTGELYAVSVNVAGVATSPLGTVSVSDGSANCQVNLTAGVAPNSSGSCNLASLSIGSKVLTATYNPSNTDFLTSDMTAAHLVNIAATSLAISGPANSQINQPTAFLLSLDVTAPGSGMPAGIVTLSSGANQCQVTLPDPTPDCLLSLSTLGASVLDASFVSSDGNYLDSSAITGFTWVYALADLEVSKDDGVGSYYTNDQLTYTLKLKNNGPDFAPGVRFRDIVPASLLNVSWTCTASLGAVCPVANGVGSIDNIIDTLPANGLLTYTLAADLPDPLPANVENMAEVILPDNGSIQDPQMDNQSQTDLDFKELLLIDGFEDPE
jgi:uncharacterized repeat protein (TIGR01451 family)